MITSPRTLRTWIVAGCMACPAFYPREVHAGGADPGTATTAQKNDAQKRFDRGRELANAKRFSQALAEYQISYEIVASPNTHFSIARTLVSLGQFGEAYVEFGKTMAEAQAAASKDKRYAQAADAADAEQRDLRPKIAFVVVSVEHGDGATVKIGDREVDRAILGSPFPVTPGTITVAVSNGGVEVARQTVTLSATDNKTIVLDGTPKTSESSAPVAETGAREQPVLAVDRSPRGLRTAAFVAGGVGVAGLATFVIFGALEKSTYNNLQDACHGGPCPPERADDISTGKSRQTIANIGLVAGLVGAAAGAVLFVVSAPSSKTQSSASASVVVAPGFVALRGSL
jgi:hypothetical protein